jgi:hypothetical protein
VTFFATPEPAAPSESIHQLVRAALAPPAKDRLQRGQSGEGTLEIFQFVNLPWLKVGLP